MKPPTLTFRYLERSPALESSALEFGQRLQRVDARMTACHIVLDGNPAPPAQGSLFAVRIHVSVPGAQIHADSVQGALAGHREMHAALSAAFDNARRQLNALQVRRCGAG